jgi:hypothetical protein
MDSEIQDLDPEILSQIMALGGLSDEEKRLGVQMTGAKELQNAPAAQGRMVGGIYVKASPFQHAVTAMKGIRGYQQEADINRRLGEISLQRTAARGAMAGNVPRGEPDIYSVLSAQDEPTATQRADAVRKALAQRRQIGTAGMLSGDSAIERVGGGLVSEAQQGGEALGQAGQSRLKMALAAQEATRKAEKDAAQETATDRRLSNQESMQRQQLAIAQQRLNLENQRLGQDVWSAVADPVSGGIIRYNKKTGESAPLVKNVAGGKQPYMKALSEEQGKAAMYLEQGRNALKQAMKMGRDILPSSGLVGGKEKIAWAARSRGLPQLSSRDELARQSLLISLAEPIVRAETGAGKNEGEIRDLTTRYIPTPGEPKEEQARKLRSLIGAIRAVQQKLPPQKAEEFQDFYNDAEAWAASILEEEGTGSGSPTAPLANPDSYYE